MNFLSPEQRVFVDALIAALGSINEPLLFGDERGYQGQLLQELAIRYMSGGFPDDPIVQQEYQKTLPLHGIRIRPDIIVHVPFGRGGLANRHQGNFVTIELKRDAGEKAACQAFGNLQLMKDALAYPLTIFINIDSDLTHFNLCPDSISGQTICFSVCLVDGAPNLKMDGLPHHG